MSSRRSDRSTWLQTAPTERVRPDYSFGLPARTFFCFSRPHVFQALRVLNLWLKASFLASLTNTSTLLRLFLRASVHVLHPHASGGLMESSAVRCALMRSSSLSK